MAGRSGSKRTVGIDLAAQPQRTAVCEIEWSQDPPQARLLVDQWTDENLVQLIDTSTKVGIDCPLGWPTAFVSAVARHRNGEPWEVLAGRDVLTHRLTDRLIREQRDRWPLSVSTDRIGVVALRCASVLSALDWNVDRSGVGVVVEVYPAAALSVWNLRVRGSYKRSLAALEEMFDQLRSLLPLAMDENSTQLFRTKHDAFDALICAIVARQADCGQTTRPDRDQMDLAAEEGWIHLPDRLPQDLSHPAASLWP